MLSAKKSMKTLHPLKMSNSKPEKNKQTNKNRKKKNTEKRNSNVHPCLSTYAWKFLCSFLLVSSHGLSVSSQKSTLTWAAHLRRILFHITLVSKQYLPLPEMILFVIHVINPPLLEHKLYWSRSLILNNIK